MARLARVCPVVAPQYAREVTGSSLTFQHYRFPEKSEAMAQAYKSGAYTMAEIGQYFEVHYMTVSRSVRKHENAN